MKMAGEMGLEAGLFAKGGQNHLFLAQREGHTLADYGGGPDAFDGENAYEYKITMGDNFNFNYAARKSDEENEKLIRGKIRAIKGAYCAKRRFGELTDIFYIPSEELEAILWRARGGTAHSRIGVWKELLRGFEVGIHNGSPCSRPRHCGYP